MEGGREEERGKGGEKRRGVSEYGGREGSEKKRHETLSTLYSPDLDRPGRLRRVVLREQVEGPPRGWPEDPRVGRRPAAALPHSEVGDRDQRRVGAFDDRLRRGVELRRVSRVRGGLAGRGRRGRSGRLRKLGAEQRGERGRVRETSCLVCDEALERGGEGLGGGRGLDLEVEEGCGLVGGGGGRGGGGGGGGSE